ncbi:PhaM family polyhydroxyalkanoate granule multifunctional regulatory protein [Chitinimonas lacunae]|uniref:PhaM family polyhydroxyalkanoate granule multifunctional regulatory protein n=1 Tax=Chitinimonas lacunae TaxID=1963018 RepID=A0ABV8MKU2_9NEIS
MADEQNNDPFAFFRQFWKPMEQQMAGFMPPLSEEELARKIAELKTVEQWLSMQLSMLQLSIKTMELQHASLAALRRMEPKPKDEAP